MTDKELLKLVAAFRRGLLGRRSGRMMCAVVVWPLEGFLIFHGIECKAMETMEIKFDGHIGEFNHVWLQLSDGRVLDPTADQFNDLGFGPMPKVYLGKPLKIHRMAKAMERA